MFQKRSNFADNNIVKLNTINAQNLRLDLDKLAYIKESDFITDGESDNKFDLEAEVKGHPDSLFVKCLAIVADVMNDNGDYFCKPELKKAVATFVGVPVYTNHENNDINKARGKVVHSWWDEDKNGIMIIARVDAKAYPALARGLKEEYIAKTSMGCAVRYSICSVCHNCAEQPTEYCSCIKERKTRTVSARNQKCNYFKHGLDKECPLCASTKDDVKSFSYNGKAFEHNYGIKFIENSFVSSPAFHDCGVTEVIDSSVFLQKVAEISKILPGLLKKSSNEKTINRYSIVDANPVSSYGQKFAQEISKLNTIVPGLLKITECQKHALLDLDLFCGKIQKIQDILPQMLEKVSNTNAFCDNNTCVKLAGQKEIGELNQALDLLTSVSQAMLQQKEQIDLEFLSDLVKVLADLQTVTDELTEQGYGRLQSPTGEGQEAQQQPSTPEQSPPTATPGQLSPVNPTPGGGSKVVSGPAGGAGSVTGPASMANSKTFNFEKIAKENLLPSEKYGKKLLDISQFNLSPVNKKIEIPFSIKKNKGN